MLHLEQRVKMYRARFWGCNSHSRLVEGLPRTIRPIEHFKGYLQCHQPPRGGISALQGLPAKAVLTALTNVPAVRVF
jgi:hypothetical protein